MDVHVEYMYVYMYIQIEQLYGKERKMLQIC